MSFRFARAAAVLGTVQILFLAPAQSAPIIYGAYYAEVIALNCSDDVGCNGLFAKTPSGKFLTINTASCLLTSSKILTSIAINIRSINNGPVAVFSALDVKAVQGANGNFIYSNQHNVNLKSPSQRVPVISIIALENANIDGLSNYWNFE